MQPTVVVLFSKTKNERAKIKNGRNFIFMKILDMRNSVYGLFMSLKNAKHKLSSIFLGWWGGGGHPP